MTRLMGRRAGAVAGLVAAATTAFAVFAAPSGAATKNPCKVLTKREIQTAFGGTVGSPKKGVSPPVSTPCEYKVSADGDRPAGTVIVNVMTIGAKAAYTGLEELGTTYVPISGVPRSLYAEKLHVVDTLKGNVLLGVQGNFGTDVKTQLTDLAQIGIKRI